MIDLHDNEARHVAMLYRHMLRQLDRELAPHRIGPGRYAYLFALYRGDGRSQQALADAVGADKGGAARALARLEADGLVQRRADAGDRRAVRVFLTTKGRRLRQSLERAAASGIDLMLAPLTAEERAQLRVLLRKMTASLGGE